jgi:hypothetical protein
MTTPGRRPGRKPRGLDDEGSNLGSNLGHGRRKKDSLAKFERKMTSKL